MSDTEVIEQQRQLLDSLIRDESLCRFVAWYYTPMALAYSNHIRPELVVYDCMDELSAFAGASPVMRQYEAELFSKANLVFTGGASLYEAKKTRHDSVHLFPSSVDVAHFRKARQIKTEPEDQRVVPYPRIGYAGVIDERMDLELVREVSSARPNVHFIMLGPVAKIDPDSLPKADNIHYLGMKKYSELPAYFSGWQIGMLPFALNDSTRFISPTKTPEYLAAGLTVLSTPIRDVVTPYGELGLVNIADSPREFIRLTDFLVASQPDEELVSRREMFLSQSSWDRTWRAMNTLIEKGLGATSVSVANPSNSPESKAAEKDVAHV